MTPHGRDAVRGMLRPLSALWGVASRTRNLLYDRGLASVRQLPRPVVSVGNITVGGTGKTPLTIHLARRLLEEGLRPLVLSRGYGSKGTGTRIVSDGRTILAGPDEAGDEPVLIARSVPGCPVVVDPNRVRGGLQGIARFSPDLVLLDDGFQHRRLARDLDIVVLDAVEPLGRYALLPTGYLREPFGGLSRADVFVVTRAPDRESLETLTTVLKRFNASAPILRAEHWPEALVPCRAASRGAGAIADARLSGAGAEDVVELRALEEGPVYAFCGIGNPDGFRTTLRTAGARLAGFEAFRDHHVYSRAELARLADAARSAGAAFLVTTEKDAVRIIEPPAQPPLYALRIRMRVPGEPALMARILALSAS